VRHIPDDWLADFPTEPWGQIKGIGNRIRHEYFHLDDAILWEIITTDSHALKTVMEAMLARHATRTWDDHTTVEVSATPSTRRRADYQDRKQAI
jgi:hypothetical protein